MTLFPEIPDARRGVPLASGSPAGALTGRAGGVPNLTLTVYGTPAPKGSKRAFRNKHTGRIHLVESSESAPVWREAVKTAALSIETGDFDTLIGPVFVEMTFTLKRPKCHYRTGRNAELLRDSAPHWPTKKPDIDKLERCTLDALKDAGVYRDDSQVVGTTSSKTFPLVDPRALDRPGALIRVWAL